MHVEIKQVRYSVALSGLSSVNLLVPGVTPPSVVCRAFGAYLADNINYNSDSADGFSTLRDAFHLDDLRTVLDDGWTMRDTDDGLPHFASGEVL